jgi:hypothetical protein
MIEVSLDFMNYNFILLLLIILGIGIYFYYEIRNIKKELFLISTNLNSHSKNIYQESNTANINLDENLNTVKDSHSDSYSDSDSESTVDINSTIDTISQGNATQSSQKQSDKLDFIMEIPDLINGELTIDKIDNIMSSDDEDNDDEDNNDKDNDDKDNNDKDNNDNITDYNIETGESDPNFIYDDDENTLQKKSVSELKAILEKDELPLTGNKSKLIGRIIDHNKKKKI